ncbi:hybrid sensor histidine kinase/response regulator [Lysobacter sp. HA35]
MSLRDEPAAESLYDEAPCGLLLTDHDGRVLRANRTFCRWAGLDVDALAGIRFPDLLTIGGRIFHQTHFAPLLQMQGSISEVKLELRRADGERIPVVVNAVRRARGDTWQDEIAVFIAKDRHAYERELMLARKRAEDLAARQREVKEELERADRRKDEFLAMLAHELRNPLAPISTAAQLMRMSDDPERLHSLGEMIARQAAHLTHLVDDLLDVSRVTRGLIEIERAPHEAASIVEAAIEQARPLLESRHHRLESVLRHDLAVEGDRTRLVQVIANLLNNAAKYTPQGGVISLEIAAVDDMVEIGVTDNGIGIDASLLPHVFDLFAQAERTPDRAQGGLGIGLSLVRSLVQLHGGTVEARSDGLHQGSRFTVRLPCVRMPEPAAFANPVPDATSARALRLLIVDDNEDAARTLADVLQVLGHVPYVALTAADALVLCERGFDACVLDIGLPDMTGYELATTLRERGHGQAVYIALSGYGQAHDRALSRAAGFGHHLVKPVEFDRLMDVLATVQPAVATSI